MSDSDIVMAFLVQKRLTSNMAQFNPVSYWESALLKENRNLGCCSGRSSLELPFDCEYFHIFSACRDRTRPKASF